MFKGYRFIVLPSLVPPSKTNLKTTISKRNTTQFDKLHSKVAKLEGTLERNFHPNYIINDKYFNISKDKKNEKLIILVNLKILENAASIVPFFNLQKTFEGKYIHEDRELFRLNYINKIKDKLIFVNMDWFYQCIYQNLLINFVPYKINIVPFIEDEASDIIDSATIKRRKIQEQTESNKFADDGATNKTVEKSEDSIRDYLNNIHLLKLQDNPNLNVIKILSDIKNEYSQIEDDFRVKAYNSAINSLMMTKEFINDAEKAKKLPGIGNKISLKIEEFFRTGTLKILDELRHSNTLLKQLNHVYGFANKTSENYIKKYDLKNFDDFKKKVSLEQIQLTDAQSLGLKYYDDWNMRIPRERTDFHALFLKEFIKNEFKGLEMFVMGSYRRNLTFSWDIDLILVQKTLKTKKQLNDSKISKKFIQKLKELDYIKCVLSGNNSNIKVLTGVKLFNYNGIFDNYTSHKDSVDSEFKICRRMDFLFVPYNEFGASMLYFTGNDTFSRLLRQVAVHENMLLNSHGLFNKNDSKLIESFDEKKIFEVLKVKYSPAEERNIGEYERLPTTTKINASK